MSIYTAGSKKFIPLILTGLFGILALIIGFMVWNGGVFELRSKAASTETVVKEWDFTKGNISGWTGGNGVTVTTPDAISKNTGAYLQAVYATDWKDKPAARLPNINRTESVTIPAGIRKVKVWMRVLPTDNISLNAPESRLSYSSHFTYRNTGYLNSGNDKQGAGVSLTGTTGQSFKLYEAQWSETLPLTLKNFQIGFNSIEMTGSVAVQIQRIQIVVTPIVPSDTPKPPKTTPTPTVAPQVPPRFYRALPTATPAPLPSKPTKTPRRERYD